MINLRRFDLVWLVLIQAVAVIFLTISFIYSTITDPPWFTIFTVMVVYASMIVFYIASVSKSNMDKENRLNERSNIIIKSLLDNIENRKLTESLREELEEKLIDLFTIHYEEL
jgi:hypothetical protein